VGSQYRSVILFHTLDQKKIAEQFLNNLKLEKIWDTPIVTQIKPLKVFYKAEEYHQQYFNRNPEKPYCRFIIEPKLRKLRKTYNSKLKKDKDIL
jgi:peptide-methionine (S)-S-oxide reductase